MFFEIFFCKVGETWNPQSIPTPSSPWCAWAIEKWKAESYADDAKGFGKYFCFWKFPKNYILQIFQIFQNHFSHRINEIFIFIFIWMYIWYRFLNENTSGRFQNHGLGIKFQSWMLVKIWMILIVRNLPKVGLFVFLHKFEESTGSESLVKILLPHPVVVQGLVRQ